MKLNTYIHFSNGKCEEALNFYVKALGAKPVMMLHYSEAPAGNECANDMQKKIMHGRITLGDGVIMASDSPAGYSEKPAAFSINIGVDSPEEAERLFAALSENAEIRMPMAETFWAKRFGMLVDQFGVPWMVNCEKKQG
jgi:PhnB protein